VSGTAKMRSKRSISAMVCSASILLIIQHELGMGQTARTRGVPLSMSRMQPEFLDADPSSRSRAADVLVREEQEDEEDEEDDRKEEDDEDKEDDEGYSE